MSGGYSVILSPCKTTAKGARFHAGFVLLLWFIFTALPASAQDRSGKPAEGQPPEKIHIVADELTSDSQNREAEFSGNVQVTQGSTVITSDRLKIFYSEDLSTAANSAKGEGSIKKIVASGNVKILFDNRVAVSQQAVYNTDTKILVLTGSNSKITSGNDSISGEKITYNRSDGHITVESGHGARVEAIFHPGGNGIR